MTNEKNGGHMNYLKRSDKFLKSLLIAESIANQEVIQKGFDASNVGLAFVSLARQETQRRFTFSERHGYNPIKIDETLGLTLFAENLEALRIDRRHELRNRKEIDEVLKNISTMLRL